MTSCITTMINNLEVMSWRDSKKNCGVLKVKCPIRDAIEKQRGKKIPLTTKSSVNINIVSHPQLIDTLNYSYQPQPVWVNWKH